ATTSGIAATAAELGRADLDGAVDELWRLLALLHRVCGAVRFDDDGSADDFLRRGVRSVGDRNAAAVASNDASFLVAKLVALAGDAVDPGAVFLHDRLQLLGAEALGIPVGVAKHDQVLGHR